MNTRTRVWSVVAVSALAVALRAVPEGGDRRVHRAQNCVGAPAAVNWESGDPFLVMGGFVDGTSGQAAAVQTRAAVLFEPERLHLVIECLEPAMDRLAATTAASGRDGEVFKDDCIEIFISPAGSEKEYYHLAANALGAQFDERVRERSWNPDWTVQATRLADRWRLQVSIPFAALGGAPAAGAVWWVNLCRQRQASGTLELSAWSPTGQDFHAVRNFGRLVFGTDYAACLRRVALTPVDERLPRLRQRAAIDAKAAAQLEAHLQAVEARLAPLRAAVAAPAGPAAAEFAALLRQGYAALATLDDAAQSLDGAIASLECAAAMSRLAGP